MNKKLWWYNKSDKKALDIENSLCLPFSQKQWEEIKIEHTVKFNNDQTLKFMNQTYGLVNSPQRRIYVSPREIKITINAFGEMYYQDLNRRLYLTLNWQNKKVTLPTRRELKELHKKLLAQNFRATPSELKAFEDKLNKTINYLKRNKNSNIIINV